MKTITLKLTKQEILALPLNFETKYCQVLDKNSDEQYWSVIIKNTDKLVECINKEMDFEWENNKKSFYILKSILFKVNNN